MKPLFISLIFLTTCCLCCAQQIELSGRVSIHNSGYRTGNIQYVQNAYVSAKASTPTQTDGEGAFELLFQGIEAGALVNVTVEKDQLEVVNSRELKHVVLGRTTPLRVFLAHPDSLARAQAELREVSLAAVTARYDALIARLRAGEEESRRVIEELEAQLNREIEHRFEAEELLQEQLEALKERLPETTRELARVNLDFASEVYREAYELYRQGDFEQAIAILDEAELSSSSEAIISNMTSLEEDRADYETALAAEEEKIDQIVQSYRLKAEAYNLIFDYVNSVRVFKIAVNLLEELKNGAEDLELADAYGRLGFYLLNGGRYDEALKFLSWNKLIREELSPTNDPELGVAYNNLASCYLFSGSYQEALHAQQKAINIGTASLVPNDRTLAFSYNNLASIYQYLGDYPAALKAIKEAISIKEQESLIESANLADSYNNLASIYLDIGDYEAALIAIEKAMTIQNKITAPNPPRVAVLYNTLALVHYNLKNYDRALSNQLKALRLTEETLDPFHPQIATNCNNLGSIYQALGNQEEALLYMERAIEIEEHSLDSDHPKLAASYNNLASLLKDMDNYSAALIAMQNAHRIHDVVMEPTHPYLGISCHNLSSIYFHLDLLDSAIIYEVKAYLIWNEKLPKDHPDLLLAKDNLAGLYGLSAEKHKSQLDFVLARENFSRALAYAKDSAALYNQIGLCYYYEGKWKEAIEQYQISYSLNSELTPSYLNNIGMAYAKAGDFEEAHARFEQLQAIMPEQFPPYRAWGLYHALTSEFDTALDNLEQAINLGYTDKNWLQTEEALAPLRELPRFQELLDRIPDE